MDEFAGKAVIVTGASGGIGHAAALEFARRGALVAMVARSLDRLSAAIPEELRARCFPVAADVSTAEGCEAAYKGCIAALDGRLDVLVNNAGGALLGTRIATSDEEWWDYHMDLNVKSVVRLTRHCSALLTESRGCIVNLSSIAASRPFVGGAAYCTAKAAVEMFTKCSALELAPAGVRVVGVAPATVTTAFHATAGMGEDGARTYYSEPSNVQAHPLGRLGRPEDIADAICFLASPRASWVTGTTLAVDGGRLLTMAIGKSLAQSAGSSD